MAWDDDAYYETELEIPSGRYGKLLAMPGGVGPAGPVGPIGPIGETGPVGPVGPSGNMATFASLSAFPAAGNTANLYVAADTNDSYRWDGTKYVRVSERVKSTGIEDSTVVGRKVITAVDEAAGRTALQLTLAEPEMFGGKGDATTNDTASFVSLFAKATAAHLRKAYKLNNVIVTARAITGEMRNRLVAAVAPDPVTGLSPPILTLGSGSSLSNVTIDGEGANSNRVDMLGQKISVQDVNLVNCPTNSLRASGATSEVRLVNIYADNAKVFNTTDTATPKNLLFSGIMCVNAPNEAFLIDLPGSNSDWTGFVLSNSVWQASANTKRAIGIARAVGGVITGQVIRGALNTDPFNSVDTDLIHFEDRASTISVVGNVFETNGTTHALDVSSGGDPAYTQEDRLVKDILFSGNLYKATDDNTNYLIWMEGEWPNVYERISIHNEALMCNGVTAPLQVLLKSGVIGPNSVYEATGPEFARDGVGIVNSPNGANIIRRTTNHVSPKFFRGNVGHGYNPENILFRTTFGHDTYTNFQAWANLIRTQTGATIASFGGSLGGGTITFETDADSGARYLRATRGASAMTARMDLTWTAKDADFQNLDALCARILTRSSKQSAGKAEIAFPNAGPALGSLVLNSGADFASWKADGGSKITTPTANFTAANAAVQVRIYFGDGLAAAGDTCDFGILAISVNRSTPF